MAPQWDEDTVRHDDVISAILDNAGVRPGVRVPDVACSTGVDISPEMVRIGMTAVT